MKNKYFVLPSRGQTIKVAAICGGLSQSSLFVRTHADVLGVPVVRPRQVESVLLGAAILGAAAASASSPSNGEQERLEKILAAMGGGGDVTRPDPATRDFHEKKYRVFRTMGEDQIKYRAMMKP